MVTDPLVISLIFVCLLPFWMDLLVPNPNKACSKIKLLNVVIILYDILGSSDPFGHMGRIWNFCEIYISSLVKQCNWEVSFPNLHIVVIVYLTILPSNSSGSSMDIRAEAKKKESKLTLTSADLKRQKRRIERLNKKSESLELVVNGVWSYSCKCRLRWNFLEDVSPSWSREYRWNIYGVEFGGPPADQPAGLKNSSCVPDGASCTLPIKSIYQISVSLGGYRSSKEVPPSPTSWRLENGPKNPFWGPIAPKRERNLRIAKERNRVIKQAYLWDF